MKNNDEKKSGNGGQPPIDPDLEAEADALVAEQESDAAAEPEAAGEPAKPPEVPLDQALAQFLDITFNGLLAKRGEYWRMQSAELEVLSKAYAAVILKYWPDFDLGVELTGVVITVTVLGPRLAAHQAARAAAGDDKPDAGDSAKTKTPAKKKTPAQTTKD